MFCTLRSVFQNKVIIDFHILCNSKFLNTNITPFHFHQKVICIFCQYVMNYISTGLSFWSQLTSNINHFSEESFSRKIHNNGKRLKRQNNVRLKYTYVRSVIECLLITFYVFGVFDYYKVIKLFTL